MGLFDKFKGIQKNANDAGDDLLKKHETGDLNDTDFLQEFAKINVFYTTPFGSHKDGNQRLFLIPVSDKMGYNPVFSSKERMTEFYEKAGRVSYTIISASFASFLKATKKINDGAAPIKMGAIIDPGHYDVTVDAAILNKVIEITG